MEAMKPDTPHLSLALAPILLTSLLLAACGGGDGNGSSSATTTATEASAGGDEAAGESDAGSGSADGTAADGGASDGQDVNPEATDTAGVLGYDGEQAQSSEASARETAQAVRSGRRDVLKQPFAQNSIWNMPIGTGAQYVNARLSTRPRNDAWAPMPSAERDHIVLRPTAPVTPIYRSNAGWSGRSRCERSNNTVLARVPIPANYVVASARTNDSAAFLLSDRRTVVSSQPLARCYAGGIATGWTTFPTTDIYGDGIAGSHGGSGMSALGGTLRVGEMRPGSEGPQHALKMVVDAATMLTPCSTRSACFRWPARGADTYAVGYYGRKGTSAPSGMKMGALLALPRTLSIGSLGLETAPGRQLAWTLQNYGAYIVDDTYGAGISFAVEVGPDGRFEDQFRRDYGFGFEARSRDNTPWARDVRRIVAALHLVNNNSSSRIGGGGTPLQPLAAGF